MTVCERVQDDLKAFLDGELRWPALWSVRRHLASCAGCRREMSEMETLQTRLRASDPGELPAALRARILAAAGDISPSGAIVRPRKEPFPLRPRLVWGAVGGLGLIVVLCWPLMTGPGGLLQAPSASKAANVAGGSGGAPASAVMGGAPAGSIESGGASSSGAVSEPASEMNRRGAVAARAAGPPATRPAPVRVAVKGGGAQAGARDADVMESASQFAAAPHAGSRMPAAAGALASAAGRRYPSPGDAPAIKEERQVALSGANKPVTSATLGANGTVQMYRNAERKPATELILLVDNVSEKAANIKAAAQAAGGEVTDRRLLNYEVLSLANAEDLTIDVPAAKFKETLDQIKKQGDVIAKPLPSSDAETSLQSLGAPPPGSKSLHETGENTRGYADKGDRGDKGERPDRGANAQVLLKQQTPALNQADTKLAQQNDRARGRVVNSRAAKPGTQRGAGSDARFGFGPQRPGQAADLYSQGAQDAAKGKAPAGLGAGVLGGGGGFGGGPGGFGRSGGGQDARQDTRLDARQGTSQETRQAGGNRPAPPDVRGQKKEAQGRDEAYNKQAADETKANKRASTQPQQNRSMSPSPQAPSSRGPVRLQAETEKVTHDFLYTKPRPVDGLQDGYARITVRLRLKQSPPPPAGAAGGRKP